MDSDTVLRIGREALVLVLLLSALPVLAAALIGLVVSLFQAATQLQEQTLTMVPKLVAVFAALMIGGPWMVRELAMFTTTLFELIRNKP